MQKYFLLDIKLYIFFEKKNMKIDNFDWEMKSNKNRVF